MIPVVDVFKCHGCGTCVKRCPEQIMGLIGGKSALHARLCVECGVCAEVCPYGAILFELPGFAGYSRHEGYRPTR
jgi:ferredoxin